MENVKEAVAGLVIGAGTVFLTIRARMGNVAEKLAKVERHESLLASLEQRVARGESDASEARKSMADMNATLNRMAQDVAFLRGRAEGLEAAK